MRGKELYRCSGMIKVDLRLVHVRGPEHQETPGPASRPQRQLGKQVRQHHPYARLKYNAHCQRRLLM